MDLSVRDSAQLLKVSEKTIYRWVKQGKLPAYRINEQYRFNRAELLEWATSQRLNVGRHLRRAGQRQPGGQLDGSPQAAIHYRPAGAIAWLAVVIGLCPCPSKSIGSSCSGSLARGIGGSRPWVMDRGAARPQPDRDAHRAAMVTLCFLERRLSLGRQKANRPHVFTIVSPIRAHLNLLAGLALHCGNGFGGDRQTGTRDAMSATPDQASASGAHPKILPWFGLIALAILLTGAYFSGAGRSPRLLYA
jgi:PTS system nitrogen regulatory IIA component